MMMISSSGNHSPPSNDVSLLHRAARSSGEKSLRPVYVVVGQARCAGRSVRRQGPVGAQGWGTGAGIGYRGRAEGCKGP